MRCSWWFAEFFKHRFFTKAFITSWQSVAVASIHWSIILNFFLNATILIFIWFTIFHTFLFPSPLNVMKHFRGFTLLRSTASFSGNLKLPYYCQSDEWNKHPDKHICGNTCVYNRDSLELPCYALLPHNHSYSGDKLVLKTRGEQKKKCLLGKTTCLLLKSCRKRLNVTQRFMFVIWWA